MEPIVVREIGSDDGAGSRSAGAASRHETPLLLQKPSGQVPWKTGGCPQIATRAGTGGARQGHVAELLRRLVEPFFSPHHKLSPTRLCTAVEMES